ncbi:hypothetical protein [Bilophila wadsworthia]|uniref:hypothetical protein n=1 Tax=Bilophila wadsworthia TaxID=35833 RepID=UPI00399CDA80
MPTPAVNKATLVLMPVRIGTSTSAPNATKSICAPSRESFSRKEYVVSDSISTPQKKMYVPCPLAAPAYRA